MFDLVALVSFIAMTIVAVSLIIYLRNREKEVIALSDKLKEVQSEKKSLEVKFGLMMEKWVPYLDNVGFDPQKARYIGDPIDYVIFDDNEILFLEIKTGEARLNKHQSKVKTLIETGKVSFKTLRIK